MFCNHCRPHKAYGVKLDVLSKLSNLKAQPPLKGSLLTYVAMEYDARITGSGYRLSDEEFRAQHFPFVNLNLLEQISKSSFSQIEQDVKIISSDIDEVIKELKDGT